MPRLRLGFFLLLSAIVVAALPNRSQGGKAGEGMLEVTIVDQATGKVVPCRVHLKNSAGVSRKVLKTPFWHDHFACPGTLTLKLPRGNYTFLVERGPEYAESTGYFTINDFAEDRKVVPLKRAVDMAADNWWAGDLDLRRDSKTIEMVMQAEDLYVAVLADPEQKAPADDQPPEILKLVDGRTCELVANFGPDAAAGLRRIRLPVQKPAEFAAEQSDSEPAKEFWYNALATADDLPVWLAEGKVDSIRLFGEEMVRPKWELPGKTVQRKRNEPVHAAAGAAQQAYFHALNCGFQLSPSAGSASGAVGNPAGYHRMYAWVDKLEFDLARWWDSFAMGRVTVTNGPLIRPQANGQLPGHLFTLIDGTAKGGTVEIDIAMNMTTRDPLSYLEIIKNGQPTKSIRIEEWAKTGHFPLVRFDASGWCLVRVVTDVQETYRAALSAPWYVEGTDGPRISRKSATYFLDRLDARIKQLAPAGQPTGPDTPHGKARQFWVDLSAKANAE